MAIDGLDIDRSKWEIYIGNRKREYIWNILIAYVTTGYLPCDVAKEGYFNTENFYK
jgi:hypothetical protein